MKSTQIELPNGVLIAAIPVLGTAAAYLFEFGFSSFHGIPSSLITLSISQLVGTSILGLAGLLLIHIYFATGIALIARREHFLFRLIGLGMLYSLLPFLLFFGAGNSKQLWILFAITFIYPTFLSFVEALSSRNTSTPFLSRWKNSSLASLQTPPTKTDGLENVIDKPHTWITVTLFFAVLTTGAGIQYASSVAPTVTIEAYPDKVLVAIYGDRWFLRPIKEVDRSRNSIGGELLILSGEKLENVMVQGVKKVQKS